MTTLPPELISHILHHIQHDPPNFRNRHLARCCLISTAFQELAAPLLYHTANIVIGFTNVNDSLVPDDGYGMVEAPKRVKMDEATLLLRTLASSPVLANHVHCLEVSIDESSRAYDHPVLALDETRLVFEATLQLPELRNIKVVEARADEAVVMAETMARHVNRGQIKILDMCWSRWMCEKELGDALAEACCAMDGLEVLRLRGVSGIDLAPDHSTSTLTPPTLSLKRLAIPHVNQASTLSFLTANSTATLQALELRFPINIKSLQSFSTLSSLHLTLQKDYDDPTPPLSQLASVLATAPPTLINLTLSNWNTWDLYKGILMDLLPPTIQHLTFIGTSYVAEFPSDMLAFLTKTTHPELRRLTFDDPRIGLEGALDEEALRGVEEVCRKDGIVLVLVGRGMP